MNKRLIYRIFLFVWAMLGALACTKEDLPEYSPIGEGDSNVSMGITFRPLTGATLGGSTRSEKGDSIGVIDNVFIAWYGTDRTLVGSCYLPKDKLRITTSDRPTQPDGTTPITPPTGETKTQHAEFDCKIPYGRYRIYAVANVGDLTNDDRIQKEQDFKAIPLEWQTDDISKNCQMSGYFKVEGENPADSLAVIDRPNLSLHAWIRRAVSKVTIAFDATRLNENIYIYLKTAQIRDIPKTCPLVDTNNPTGSDQLWEEGDTIVYGRGDDYEKWVRLSCGRGANEYGSHDNDAPSLFFYENMQGKHENKHQYKNYESKDDVPYGTYVEVTGYYVNNSADHPSYGNIIYRCMLGKNMENDFNAERNSHYKLTLVFNKDANDVDWHIDYDYVPKPPEIVVPNPMYISYLSNRFTNIPVTVYYDPKRYRVESLTATIVKNDWAFEGHPYYNDYLPDKKENLNKGFLSLTRVNATSTALNTFDSEETYTNPKMPTDTTCLFTVPVYTRPMTVGLSSDPVRGFSGNNYYVGRRRHATVKLVAKVKDIVAEANGITKTETLENTIEIIQVRRIVNPKGIWRAGNSEKEFRVTIKNTNSNPTVADKFDDVVSEGPWSAFILKGADWIRIKDIDAGEDGWGTDTIKGGTGSKVEFDYKPAGQYPDGCRFGLIEVRVHDNTCPHIILVSQGMGPVNIGKYKWHMSNVKYCGVDEDNPLLEGSMFKFGWSSVAFRSKNNLQTDYGFFLDAFDKTYDTYDINGNESTAVFSKVEADITGFTNSKMNKADKFGTSHVATSEEWADITDIDKYTRYYGIMYGDECTKTLDTKEVTNTYTDVGEEKGMRGCFICDNNTGVHLFFPIGNTGHGRRQFVDNDNAWKSVPRWGVLKYANRTDEMPRRTALIIPPLYDLWQETGAVYWYKEKDHDGYYGFDINYFTFGFSSYSTQRVWEKGDKNAPDMPSGKKPDKDQSDICLIRRVYD